MSEGFDLSDIPLACDTQSDLDSTSELPVPSINVPNFSDCDSTFTEPSDVSNVVISNHSENTKYDNVESGEFEVKSESGAEPGRSETSSKNGVEQEKFESEKSVRSSEKRLRTEQNRYETEKYVKSSENCAQPAESETRSKNGVGQVESGPCFEIEDSNSALDKVNEGSQEGVEFDNYSPETESNLGGKVRTEEEMMLREFDLLDEVGPFDNDEKTNDFCDEDYSCDDEEDDDYLSEDEVDAMLEEGIGQSPFKKMRMDDSTTDSVNNNSKDENDKDSEDYVAKQKIVLVGKVKNHFEVLPDGWISVTHNSGMPLYLHKSTRVCTLSKPYSLGPGSVRKHAIPLSAIPCLEYRRAKEERQKNAETEKPSVLVVNGTEIPNARIETAQENELSRQLEPHQLTEYCKNLFEFETIQVLRFKSWVARRKFRRTGYDRITQRPTLPKDTKLITCPIRPSKAYGKTGQTREWIMNPSGKSYVCILHEYVQRALKDQPVYTFKELENTATPYMAIVNIGNIQYGTGYGSSKKQAKHDAAKVTLEILIPEMKDKINQDEKLRGHVGNNKGNTDLSFFDSIKIEDPRVTELCTKTTEPLPHEILLTCLQRNFGMTQTNIKYETTPVKHCQIEFTMTVGSHTAKVMCKNKRDGKQKASQAMLQALHPHIPSWGSLLRLYGNTSVKTVKEKKIEEQEITLLQNKGNSHSPNYAILNKLKEEMKKFKAMKSAVKPIGKFIPPDDIELPAGSHSDLNNVQI